MRLGAGTAHQHRAFTVAQAIGLAEGLDGLFVVDDREGASPVGTPPAALEPQASNTRASGSQMSADGYGSRDSVQAPLILITAFGRLATSSTFGRSAVCSGLLTCARNVHEGRERAGVRADTSKIVGHRIVARGTTAVETAVTID